MRIEWDEQKRKSNLQKHGFDFRDAHFVFAGDTASFLDDREDYGEDRYVTLGLLRSIVVVLIHTEDDTHIRMISMRRATSHEEKLYFSEIGN
jgi:hypothetical protein